MKNTLSDDLMEKGQFYLLNKKYSLAIEKFKQALKSNPCSALLFFYLGLAYEGGGHLDEAKEMYRKALLINPEYEEAKKRLLNL